MQSRIKEAIEFLKDRESILVGDLRLSLNDAGAVQVTGWSNYTDFRNLNKQICSKELGDVKSVFSEMLASSEEFSAFIHDKPVEYYLDYDDYGKTSIGICSEINGYLIWHIDLK
jgi:hypothetical protein